MATRAFDFSEMTARERIQLAEELWDSLDPSDVAPSQAQAAELDQRRERLQRDGSQGRPWHDVIEELKKRGG